jgi:hypothetical protein
VPGRELNVGWRMEPEASSSGEEEKEQPPNPLPNLDAYRKHMHPDEVRKRQREALPPITNAKPVKRLKPIRYRMSSFRQFLNLFFLSPEPSVVQDETDLKSREKLDQLTRIPVSDHSRVSQYCFTRLKLNLLVQLDPTNYLCGHLGPFNACGHNNAQTRTWISIYRTKVKILFLDFRNHHFSELSETA